MKGGAAAAALEILLQALINVAKEEISLIRGLHKDAQHLNTTLAMIQTYLNVAEKKFIAQESVKTVSFDAHNVLGELNYHLLFNKANNTKTVKEKVLSFFSSFDHVARPPNVARVIKLINMDFDSINKRATEVALENMDLDPFFVGRDDDVSKLVDMLTETPDERMFSILAIVGMGGIGEDYFD